MERTTRPAALAFSELLIEIFRLNGLALEAGDVLANPAGLSSARWQVLGVVDHGHEPVAEVARQMGLARQSVQQTADALERDGFVTYLENPRHRTAKLIAITAAGRKALRSLEARHAVWAARLGAQVDPKSLRALVEGLRHVRDSMERDAARRAATGSSSNSAPRTRRKE
jgi:DNA-binding MarR family transcriptional regulator